MPPIKNWSKIDNKRWEHSTGTRLVLYDEGAVVDGRHSLWFAYFRRDGGQITDTDFVGEEVVHGATTLQRARKEAVSWMRDNPMIPHDPDPECECHDCQKWLADEREHYYSLPRR